MFAILKDGYGMPVALFEIDKETPKRYYGKITDTLNRDKWFWLRGLNTGRGRDGAGAYCEKDIVLCLVRTENRWAEVKDDFYLISQCLKRTMKTHEAEWNAARDIARRAEADAITAARLSIDALVADVQD